MIAKIIPRKYGTGSFKDSVNYNLGLSRGEKDKVEYVNTLNIFAQEAAISEMEALALENTRSKDPVFNCVLSWREGEIPSRQQIDGAVGIVLAELGLEGCQVHYALHRNTQNLHLHLCVNRIDPETLKARDPAHGWTKKALERAARRIELAQGWDVEQSGRYSVTQDGEIQEKTVEGEGLKLSQTARDIEAHTGTKSAERVAQEKAAPIIREAKSWGELHKNLAGLGVTFERKGSGAVLRLGETIVKASQAGRDISLSRLEKRLGEFIPHEGSVPTPPSQPIEKVASSPRIKGSWGRYQEARNIYFKAKREASSELRERQKKEREGLSRQQRQERSSLLALSWKGRGWELNQRRSVMAATQKGEALSLRDRHKEEREELKRRFPRQLPSFKEWLSREMDPMLAAAFRYPGQPVLFATTGENEPETPLHRLKKYDLRNYSPVSCGRRGVMYRKEGSRTADFIDYGRMIVFPTKHTEESVLAALQLASQKWGAVQLSGSEDYKRLCIQVAAKHDIRIANPELRVEMERARRACHQENTPEKSRGWSR